MVMIMIGDLTRQITAGARSVFKNYPDPKSRSKQFKEVASSQSFKASSYFFYETILTSIRSTLYITLKIGEMTHGC